MASFSLRTNRITRPVIATVFGLAFNACLYFLVFFIFVIWLRIPLRTLAILLGTCLCLALVVWPVSFYLYRRSKVTQTLQDQ